MARLSVHGKNKCMQYRDKYTPSIVIEADQSDQYWKMYRLQQYSTYDHYLSDLDIDVRDLQQCKIPYFCFDRWNFTLAYLYCYYSGKFSRIDGRVKSSNDAYRSIIKISHKIGHWSNDELIKWLKWFGEKPDYTPINHELLYIQALDVLFTHNNNITLDTIKVKKWQKKCSYLFIDHNLIVDLDVASRIKYRDDELYIVSNNGALLQTIQQVLSVVRKQVIDDIQQTMINNKRKDKKCYNLDTNKVISHNSGTKLFHHDIQYCICSNSTELFEAYLSFLKENISPHDFRLAENLGIIRDNIDNDSYINIETWKKNKHIGGKQYVSQEYRFISDDKELHNYYMEAAKIAKLPQAPPEMLIVVPNVKKIIKQKPPKRKAIPQRVKLVVWREAFNGSMDGHCLCCLAPITFENWECGHIIPHSKGGPDEPQNLRPICKACNTSMGSNHMVEWMTIYGMTGLSRFK